MWEKVKTILRQFLTQCFLPAAGLNLFIETMSRCSLFKAFGFLFTSPLVFLYNTLIIAATLSITLLVHRRTFARFILCVLWAAVGIADFVLLQFRTTPFTAVDLLMVKSAFSIMGHYLSVFQVILILAAIVLVIAGCVVLWKKAPKYKNKIHYTIALPFCALTVAVTLLFTNLGVTANLLAVNFGNLADAFHEYGLPYCFMNSLLNTGIDKPSSYSTELVQSIVKSLDKSIAYAAPHEETSQTPEPSETAQASDFLPEKQEPSEAGTDSVQAGHEPSETRPVPETTEANGEKLPAGKSSGEEIPNIIFIQLESFFDPKLLKDVTFSEDPVPYYQYLKDHFTTGYLNVPSVGAGTANTEFETITGMNLDFFGPGEYPYKTILKQTTAESICYNLKKLGVSTHAIHNNDATFYDRHIVFSQLGFETFTPIEYMNDLEMTPLGWAKDYVLTGEIEKTLDSTQGSDFIYTISVQGHGAYPTSQILEDPKVTLTVPEDYPESQYYGLLYYINEIREMDEFIKQLTDSLSERDEKTVLVLYGDHLPGFQFTADDMENGSLFQTQYVMWSNFEIEREYKDLEAYQLSSYVLSRLGISEGLITKLHQKYADTDASAEQFETYQDELKVLEYDMLYGDLDCYDGENPHESTSLQMGVNPIRILSVKKGHTEDGEAAVLVNGRNFTTYSNVFLNGERQETEYVDSTTLAVKGIGLNSGDEFTVGQIGKDGAVVGSTKVYAYKIDNTILP